MCYIDLEPADLWVEEKGVAKRDHRRPCSCCRRPILKGDVYWTHFSKCDGSVTSEKMCADCHADRDEFGKAHGGMVSTPSFFRQMLADCIHENETEEDDGGETDWRPMLERIQARRPKKVAAVVLYSDLINPWPPVAAVLPAPSGDRQ